MASLKVSLAGVLSFFVSFVFTVKLKNDDIAACLTNRQGKPTRVFSPQGYGTATTGLPKDSVKLKRALGPRISKLLQSYVNLALGSATRGAISNASGAMSALASGSVDVEHLQILGGVAIDYCVTIERPDILFQSIYQQCCKVGGEGGACSLTS